MNPVSFYPQIHKISTTGGIQLIKLLAGTHTIPKKRLFSHGYKTIDITLEDVHALRCIATPAVKKLTTLTPLSEHRKRLLKQWLLKKKYVVRGA